MSEPPPDDLITPAAAAALLPAGSRRSVYRWMADGRLGRWRVVGQLLVSRAEVLGLVRASPASSAEAEKAPDGTAGAEGPPPGSPAARAAAWRLLRAEGVG
jgi:hypothetical protein